jgi:hypothetical protein
MALSPLERLDAFLSATDALAPALPGIPLALGWATVELERAAIELGAALHIPVDRFGEADDDELLGARCRVASAALPGGRSLVVLEPSTEGRLAATLARVGEGPSAIWLMVDDLSATATAARVVGTAVSLERTGPLGVERLLLGGPIHGPHRLLLGPPGTIRA